MKVEASQCVSSFFFLVITDCFVTPLSLSSVCVCVVCGVWEFLCMSVRVGGMLAAFSPSPIQQCRGVLCILPVVDEFLTP